MPFKSVDDAKKYAWEWLRNRPFARMVYTNKFDLAELELILSGAELLKKPRKKPLLIKRQRTGG